MFRASHGSKETGMPMEKELNMLMDATVTVTQTLAIRKLQY